MSSLLQTSNQTNANITFLIRFIESEADLDAALKQFLPLTQNPPLYYPELVKTGAIALLANLLSHENTDIAIDVIEIIQELTDEDVGADVDDMAEDEAEGSSGGMASRTRMAMGELIDDLVSTVSTRVTQCH